MTQDEKRAKFVNNFVTNDTDYMSAFRHNVLQYMADTDTTLHDLAELSNLSVDTLKSFLYKSPKDCKLSTAVSLAKAMPVNIDRLIGAGTMRPITLEFVEILDRLPKNEYNFLIWYIRHLGQLYLGDAPQVPELISVMTPKCANGSLVWNNEWEHESIANLDPEIRIKCFMGIRVPCVHYMPVYNNGDVLLIAQDRHPANGEHCVIDIQNNLYIARCVRVGGEYHFHSIVNDDFRACFADVNRLVGYVAHVIQE